MPGFNARFEQFLNVYEKAVQKALDFPRATVAGVMALFLLSFLLYPFIGVSFFPRTDAGQFIINMKAPTGTRLEITNEYVKRVEDIVRQVVPAKDLSTIVSNIGVFPDLSALFTQNSRCIRHSSKWASRKSIAAAASSTWRKSARELRSKCRNCAPTFNPAAWWIRF